jgi:hypothetical protein
MPRSATKALTFPLAGVSRRGAYRQQTRPFSAPWAVNVRTVGPSESRRRGGSRPGLAKFCPTLLGADVTSLIPVSYIDRDGARQHDLVYVASGVLGFVRDGVATATTAQLETDDGDTVITDDGDTIVFTSDVSTGSLQGAVRGGKVYFADSVLKSFSPALGVVETVVATAGIVPTAETLICIYRDRVFLAGQTQAWYASRTGDPTDWDYGAAMEDPGRAVAGQLSDSGQVGFVLTALIPIHDKALVLASENTLWVLRGDPTTGSMENVSTEVGIVDPDAWAMSPDGTLVFLSNDGVYVWNAGTRAAPERFSEERLPDELREVDTTANTVSMAYDPIERGYHLFLTPSSGVGTHWWIDVENRAFWPQRLAEDHQPLSAALMSEEDLGSVVIGSQDGYVRYFLGGQADDDGEDLESHVLIGPVRLSADDVRDALLAEINGVMEGVTALGEVTWRVVMGNSAAGAAESALADLNTVLDGGSPSSVKGSGSWGEGRNRVERPRARGAWLVVWLSSTAAWSYEVVSIVARQLGRHR